MYLTQGYLRRVHFPFRRCVRFYKHYNYDIDIRMFYRAIVNYNCGKFMVSLV